MKSITIRFPFDEEEEILVGDAIAINGVISSRHDTVILTVTKPGHYPDSFEIPPPDLEPDRDGNWAYRISECTVGRYSVRAEIQNYPNIYHEITFTRLASHGGKSKR